MKPIAAIFDLDGVIVDTAIYHFVAWKNLAASLGIEFTEKNNEKLKGVGRMESLDYILSLGQVQKDESEMLVLAHNKNEHYKSLISSLTEEAILPGIKVFFDVSFTFASDNTFACKVIPHCFFDFIW